MTRFHFTNGLLISTLALAAAACSSDATTSNNNSGKDGGTGGSTSSTGGSTSGSGGAKSTGGTAASTGGTAASTGGTAASTGGAAASTGGAAASTGGAKSTGGTTGDGGNEQDSGVSADCASFCTLNLATCTGANAAYASEAACHTACAGYATTGSHTASSGDTLWCRLTHTNNAKNAPAGMEDSYKALHCPHTKMVATMYCVP